MASEKDILVTKAKSFLDALIRDGIDVSEAYLFGSVAKGSADADSDIDVAVVSSDFQGIPFYDIQKISKHRRNIDLRLEIHPFSLREIETEPSHFFLKIKRDGIRIH
ncbi:MAG: nucleotidyltransferase domain-containing protein [Desulfatiglandaceae bacterium]